MRGRQLQSLPPPHPALRATFSPLGRRGSGACVFGQNCAKLSEPWEGLRMKHYLLGLDAGNTVIKAVIFDRAGNEIAAASEEGHSRMPSPGHVERGPRRALDQCAAGDPRLHRKGRDKAGRDRGDRLRRAWQRPLCARSRWARRCSASSRSIRGRPVLSSNGRERVWAI